MMPNTCIGMLLLGVAGALRRRQLSRATPIVLSLLLTLIALAIGVGTLVEYVLATNLGIDQLAVHTRNGPHPGRMSPLAALALTLLASGLLLFDVRSTVRTRPSEWLALGAGLLALVGLTGMLLGAPPLYRWAHSPVVGLSLPTGVSVLLVVSGLLLERPDAGFMRVATSPGPGSVLLRQLFLPTVLAPVLLGLLVTRVLVRMEGVPLAVATLVIAVAVIGVMLLAIAAQPINQKHEAFVQARAQTEDLVEHASDGIFVADLDGRYIEVNGAACRMLGYPRSEIIGKTIVDLLPPADVERLATVKERLLRGGVDVDEWALRRKDGSFLPVEVSAKILEDGRWQGLVRDISDRKRLEREQKRLQQEEGFLANVVSVLAETLDYEETVENLAKLCVADFGDLCIVETVEEGGHVRRRAVVHKDAGKATLARSLQNMILDPRSPHLGSSVFYTREPLLMSTVTPEYVASVRQGEPPELLNDLDAKSLMALPLLAHGRLVGSIVLIRSTDLRPYTSEDVVFAERVVLRAALAIENARLYDAAQHAVRARDEVLEVVAHDLRNPLSAILLQASRLARSGSEENRSRGAVEGITRAATRMNRLIQDLLDTMRLEAGALTVEAARVSAARILSDAVAAHEPLAASASLELRLDVTETLPDVWADRDRLLQIFENLVGNAVKFTPPGGRVALGATERDSEVLFWVSDTGAGMSDDDLASVFDRFWQARRGERHGAGLGLGIAKGLVEALGGHMWCESELGRGTTFYFTIPCASRFEGREPEQAPHHP